MDQLVGIELPSLRADSRTAKLCTTAVPRTPAQYIYRRDRKSTRSSVASFWRGCILDNQVQRVHELIYRQVWEPGRVGDLWLAFARSEALGLAQLSRG